MNINATLIGQLIAFTVFVWFCMKFVWPPLMEAIEKRQQDIADGRLAPAGRLVRDWQEAGERLGKQLELLLAQRSQRKCLNFFSSHSFPELKQVQSDSFRHSHPMQL